MKLPENSRGSGKKGNGRQEEKNGTGTDRGEGEEKSSEEGITKKGGCKNIKNLFNNKHHYLEYGPAEELLTTLRTHVRRSLPVEPAVGGQTTRRREVLVTYITVETRVEPGEWMD